MLTIGIAVLSVIFGFGICAMFSVNQYEKGKSDGHAEALNDVRELLLKEQHIDVEG